VPYSVLADPPFAVIKDHDAARAIVAAARGGLAEPVNVVASGAITCLQALRRGRRMPFPLIGPDWQVAKAVLRHQRHAILARVAAAHIHDRAGHDVAHRRVSRRAIPQRDLACVVACIQEVFTLLAEVSSYDSTRWPVRCANADQRGTGSALPAG
jgi:hypothetical protein